jgi:hypothetical protein
MRRMKSAEQHRTLGRRLRQSLLGGVFAAFIVSLAVVGPPLTHQRIPALLQLRHQVLTIDRELERLVTWNGARSGTASTRVMTGIGRAGSGPSRAGTRGYAL